MNYYALDEALAILEGTYELNNIFNESIDFSEIEAIEESINIKESLKNAWEKIKEAFIKLKDKFVNAVKKIKNFFMGIKHKHDVDRLKKFASSNININESTLIVESASAKSLKARTCTMLNTDKYREIIDAVKYENYANYTFITTTGFDDKYDRNFDHLYYESTMYDFIRNRSDQVKTILAGLDKAEKVVSHLESEIKLTEESIERCKEMIKTFENAQKEYGNDYTRAIENSKGSIELYKQKLTRLKNDLSTSLKFLSLAQTVKSNVLRNISIYDSMNMKK